MACPMILKLLSYILNQLEASSNGFYALKEPQDLYSSALAALGTLQPRAFSLLNTLIGLGL